MVEKGVKLRIPNSHFAKLCSKCSTRINSFISHYSPE